MENEEFYLSVIRGIMDKEKEIMGEKVALAKARRAPLKISPSGEIQDIYGKRNQAVDILVQQLEDVAGEKVIDSGIQNYIQSEYEKEEYEKLPERIQPEYSPESEVDGLISTIKSKIA